jgi:hypothetical protein
MNIKIGNRDQARLALLRLRRRVARAGTPRTAAGHDILYTLVDVKAIMAVYNKLDKEDGQAAELMMDVMSTLTKSFDIPRGVQNALTRMRSVAEKGRSWNAGMLRNVIFKAADELGLKLPSGMFASQKKLAARRDPKRMSEQEAGSWMRLISESVGKKAVQMERNLNGQLREIKDTQKKLDKAWANWDWQTLHELRIIDRDDLYFVEEFFKRQ